MYKNQALTLTQMLPAGLTPDDFYVLLAAAAAFMSVLAVGGTFVERDRMGGRVKALQERRLQLKGQLSGPKRRRKKPEASVHWMRQTVNRFKLLKNTQVHQAEGLLIEAGWRTKDALIVFAFSTLVAPILLGILGVICMQMQIMGPGEDLYNDTLPIAFLYAGLKLPTWIVRRKRKKRYHNIQRALADTLDLMTICAEAGLSLSATLERVSRELGIAYPEMAEELGLTALELGFLPERNKALSNLADRVKLPEIRGITSVLIQTEKYGTPIAQALRVLSAEFREARMLRAENKAAKLPAIMTVPMILFILPTLFIVIISPAIIRAMDSW